MRIFNIIETPIADDSSKIKLTGKCPFCGKINEMIVDAKEYYDGVNAYNNGMLVQDAFPKWNVDQREFILTGNCSCMWG